MSIVATAPCSCRWPPRAWRRCSQAVPHAAGHQLRRRPGLPGAAVTLLAQVSASWPGRRQLRRLGAALRHSVQLGRPVHRVLVLTALMGLVTLIFLGSDADPVPPPAAAAAAARHAGRRGAVRSAPPTCSTSMSGSVMLIAPWA